MITINNNKVSATSPEGRTATMSLEKFKQALMPPALSTDGIIMPDGVKAIIPGNNLMVVVHQTTPRVWCLKWIDEEKKKYRNVTMALPYVITMALFAKDGLHQNCEVFFTTKPLTSLDDQLLAPALLNCSKWPPEQTNSMSSWVCTQYLPFNKVRAKDRNNQIQLGLKELLKCLFETGFNKSSDLSEGNSWFTESATIQKIDKRIETVEAWEKATKKDPLFVLDVPWIKLNFSVAQMAAKMFRINNDGDGQITQASLERIVFNQQ